MLLPLYACLTSCAAIPLTLLLKKRLRVGKEDPDRWQEKMGITRIPRPEGSLIWVHAASVGEVQSALILVDKIKETFPDWPVLITSGTVTSSVFLETRLPAGVFHQYAPFDHPLWTARFLDYWQPSCCLRLESEIWPNMLMALQKRQIPAFLINARLSDRSLNRWRWIKPETIKLLSSFSLILTQTEKDKCAFASLGAKNIYVTGNLKLNARPLPCNQNEFKTMKDAVGERVLWLYASTHQGEEELAASLHMRLKETIPNLLSIIVPRHPARGEEIADVLSKTFSIPLARRTDHHVLPDNSCEIYIADTLGELGLFYRLAPLALIGRSFSNDGGGGHNPLEAAQLGCAVLHGPRVQNLQELYDDMTRSRAVIPVKDPQECYEVLRELLTYTYKLQEAQARAKNYSQMQENVLEALWALLYPALRKSIKEAV